ncbi:MAG: response regulator transcription factor [Oscillospiraceae bacterium]|jgi:DNA-binding response OmpR family regulator|nr:response regulator transcription factor [Oscillospiraceae bacterium]
MTAPKTGVLLVDDDAMITEAVASFFEHHGFRVFTAGNGRQALTLFDRENIALVLLDLMLPDLSGEDVCRALRRRSRVPIIMLTAKAGEDHVLAGLGLGADDYVTKPFSLKELHARAQAVLRRTRGDLLPLTVKNSFGGGDLVVDFEKNLVLKKQAPVALTPSEIRLLSLFVRCPGRVFTRAELIEKALGDEFDGYDRAIDSHIKNLRQKIEDDPKAPVYVLTVHGLGYKFAGV